MKDGLFSRLLWPVAVCVCAFTLVFCAQLRPALADGTTTVEVMGAYGQTEARSMLDMVNDFRTGAYIDGDQSAVWALASDGSIDTSSYQNLGELQYDYDLENAAMQRAMEIALQFDHTRPKYASGSNSSSCFEVIPSGYSTMGENIACGYGSNSTAREAFESWCETNDSYSGQGHRRNMLGSGYNRIGVAHVIIHWSGTPDGGSSSYKYTADVHYWVQEFGYKTGSTGLTETVACDTESTCNVEVLTDSIDKVALSTENAALTTVYGATSSLEDEATTSLRLEDTWPSKVYGVAYTVPVKSDFTATSQDSSIASVSGKALTANAAGSTTLHFVSSLDANATADVNLVVEQASLSDASVTFDASSYTYTGAAQMPTATVQLGSKTLTEGVDYTVAYSENENVGTATATVSGIGNYKGSAAGTFEITQKNLSDTEISMAEIANLVFNGTAQTPAVTLSFGSEQLIAGTDYSTAYSDNTDAGTAKVTVTGTGNFTGTLEGQFTIEPKPLESSMVLLDEDSFEYNGAEQAPSVTVQDTAALITENDYELSIPAAVARGAYEFTVTAKGNYTGTATKSFTITPKPLSAGMVELDAAEFTYSGAVQKPQVTVRDGETVLSSADYSVTNEGGTDVAEYNVVVTATENGNYSGSVSKVFAIVPKNLSDDMISALADRTYDGTETAPIFTVADGSTTLLADADYEIANAGAGKNVGKYTVVLAGRNNYAGTAQASYSIQAKPLDSTMLEAIPSLAYTGAAQEPSIVLRDGDTLLVKDSDYTVEYPYGATKAGTTKVTITGTGNYADAIYTSFEIAKAELTVTYAGETIDVTEAPEYELSYTGFLGTDTAASEFSEANAPVVEATGYTGEPGTYEVTFTSEGKASNYNTTCVVSGTLTVEDKAADTLAAAENLLGSELTAESAEALEALKAQVAGLSDAQRARFETLQANSAVLAGKSVDDELASAGETVGALVEAQARQAAVDEADAMLAQAKAATKGIVVAKKALAVAYNKKWTTAAQNKALTSAMTNVSTLCSDESASSTQITDAVSQLESALSAYKQSLKKGTKNTGVIKTKSKKLKWKKLKKNAQTFVLAKKNVAQKAKVTWKKVKGSAKVKVNAKTGKVTVAKKAIKKGKSLKVTISMTMAKTKSCAKTTVKQVVTISAQ